jgi:hypothetical protein
VPNRSGGAISWTAFLFAGDVSSASAPLADLLGSRTTIWASLTRGQMHFRELFGFKRNCHDALDLLEPLLTQALRGLATDPFACAAPLAIDNRSYLLSVHAAAPTPSMRPIALGASATFQRSMKCCGRLRRSRWTAPF